MQLFPECRSTCVWKCSLEINEGSVCGFVASRGMCPDGFCEEENGFRGIPVWQETKLVDMQAVGLLDMAYEPICDQSLVYFLECVDEYYGSVVLWYQWVIFLVQHVYYRGVPLCRC